MKRLCLIVAFTFLCIINCFAQAENELYDLINISIENHIKSIKGMIEKGAAIPSYLDSITMLYKHIPDGFELSQVLIEQHNIRFFNYDYYKKSALKKGVKTFQVYPVMLKSDTIQITIGSVGFSKKGKRTFLSYGSWTTSQYIYSCNKKQWELNSVEEKGI